MSDLIQDVTIVGGGDSGLLTGLALERLNPDLDIRVIDDFSEEPPQVGKSTFLAILDLLHSSLGIDEQRFIENVRPIWKATVFFRDWCGYPSFHYPFDARTKFPPTDTTLADELLYYYYDTCYNSEDHRSRDEAIVDQGKSPWYFDPREGDTRKYNLVAYHLSTKRFNAFLRELARERTVALVDDKVTKVEHAGTHIDCIQGEHRSYEADLYIDASGFSTVLKGELNPNFRGFPIPLDSAFNTQVELDRSEIVPATVVETGEYGWFWQIDTFDNRDLGYVYASEYVDDEDAREEFVAHCGGDVTAADTTKYRFNSGYHEYAWVDNCVAIGNAEGFIEPLQSTGLTVNTQAAVNLSNLLSANGRRNMPETRERYNAWVRRSWESVYDFISVHYKYSRGENDFWEAMADLEVSDRVKHLIEEFDRHGLDTNIDPTVTDPTVEELTIFNSRYFYLIMRCMGARSALYEEGNFSVSDTVRNHEDDRYQKIAENVSNHFTTEEIYNSILDR